MNQWKKIRNAAFSKDYALNQNLIKLASTEKIHAFLTNPASLYIYTYLLHYIKTFTQHWFGNETIKILDWGCGKGHISYLLDEIYTRKEARIHSCDIHAKEFAHNDSSFLQKTPLITAKSIDIIPLTHEYLLPFSENSYDIMLSFGVLEHVPNDRESLKKINRILKPNGLFFCFFLPYLISFLGHKR